ncbi:cell division protein FtsQ/DivIB [Lunatimonas lonarensis]|uniref:cell division protein FtsQ/DivIB n=1 Tax=Lunatimonas lonarensis TaxID=1232681 RepID=UPI00055DE490|nr:hypothetical protein [Lunatimonas lonarensis]
MGTNRSWKLKRWVLFAAMGMILAIYVGFVEIKGDEKTFTGLEVYVEGVSELYFVEEKEIHRMLENDFEQLKPGVKVSTIPLYELEKKVENHPFVKDAEVFVDLKGKVMVKVAQHIPLARITRPMAPDGYISTEGVILPTSTHFTPRVITIQGRGADRILETGSLGTDGDSLLELLHFIDRDKLWHAQISGIELLANGDVILQQQVGKQVIEFGKPESIEEKFKKISIYYTEIVPLKGWNTYERVNVKFKDQIICE